MLLGPTFVPPTGDHQPSTSQTQSPSLITTSPHLTLEKVERLNTLEALRASNRDMEEFLSQLRVPRIEILNLVEPLELELTEPVQEIMIILIPLGLAGLGITTNTTNPTQKRLPRSC